MDFKLTILGNSSATPTLDRNQSAHVLTYNNKNYLIDCGENTQKQFLKYGINQNRIHEVFISHLHPDHYIGLIGFIASQNLKHRETALDIYGPAGLEEIISIQLEYSESHLHFPLNFHVLPVNGREVIFEDAYLTVKSLPLIHRIPCTGFLFREKHVERKIKKSAIEGRDIPVEAFQVLKDGNDYEAEDGTVYRCADFTLPPLKPRSFAYITDTRINRKLLPDLQGVSLLYHEATFLDELIERAELTFHSTALEASRFAVEARANNLLIGHFSARYRNLEPLLEEARTAFPNTHLALEGCSFSVRNENGEQHLVIEERRDQNYR